MAAQRFGFIDWYRGLACVLMFETHAYDAWTAEPYRQGYWWWLARMFLGGFPARMFLLLAGVSLMLRFSGDLKRGNEDGVARRGAIKRGFEVFLLGYGFRIAEWIISGARPSSAGAILKFDVLQCIGMTLMISALIADPKDTQPGRLPYKSLLAALGVALTTPLLQTLGHPAWLPGWLASGLWGGHDMVPFPLFPWLSYTLTGCFVGAYLLRGAAQNRLGRTIAITAAIGAAVAIIGKIGGRIDIPIYRPTTAVPIPATPVSYLFRTGTCLVGLAVAYWLDRWQSAKAPPPADAKATGPQAAGANANDAKAADPKAAADAAPKPSAWQRFTPLLWLGQASMTVYMVHIDLVYNIWSYPIKQRVGPWGATGLVGVLTAAMIGLAYFRTARSARQRPARPTTPVRTTPVAALTNAPQARPPAR